MPKRLPCGHLEDITLRIRDENGIREYCTQCLVDAVGLKSVQQQIKEGKSVESKPSITDPEEFRTKEDLKEHAKTLGIELSLDDTRKEMERQYLERLK